VLKKAPASEIGPLQVLAFRGLLTGGVEIRWRCKSDGEGGDCGSVVVLWQGAQTGVSVLHRRDSGVA
jgi:hypothetical protein